MSQLSTESSKRTLHNQSPLPSLEPDVGGSGRCEPLCTPVPHHSDGTSRTLLARPFPLVLVCFVSLKRGKLLGGWDPTLPGFIKCILLCKRILVNSCREEDKDGVASEKDLAGCSSRIPCLPLGLVLLPGNPPPPPPPQLYIVEPSENQSLGFKDEL